MNITFVREMWDYLKGIDYDVNFTPMAKMKAMRMFLAYASFKTLDCFKWM